MVEDITMQKITANVISNLATSVAKTIYRKVSEYATDSLNKEEVEIGSAFEEYLEYVTKVYSKIKTLLYRHTPKDIYSFYECVGLKQRVNRTHKIIDTKDINNILSISNKIIITGTGGIGKSVMMKHLLLNCIKTTGYIPIIIELRALNDIDIDDIDIFDFIYETMKIMKFDLEKEYLEYGLELGDFVLLFDGFDEVKNELSNKVSKQIIDLCERYDRNYYIVSSRPLQEFIGWNQFVELKAIPLTKEQAISLINKLEYDEIIKKKFLQELDNYLFDKYETFASNPLLLTIMLMTFENRLSIPDKLNDFFEQAFTTLFHAHDATKAGFKREILSKLGYEDFKTVFSHFCFKSFFNSDYNFSEDKLLNYLSDTREKQIISQNFDVTDYLNDLTNSVCVIMQDGLDYSFTHRAFQEYFAAVYTTQLDDNHQRRFIKMWLSDDFFRYTSNYLDMLFDLQPMRFVKNILEPGIKEIKSKLKKETPADLLLLVYDRVRLEEDTNGEINVFYRSKNSYYSEILYRIMKINNIKVTDKDKKKNKQFSIFLNQNYRQRSVSLEQLVKDGNEKELSNCFSILFTSYKAGLQMLEKDNSANRARSIAGMLEEL